MGDDRDYSQFVQSAGGGLYLLELSAHSPQHVQQVGSSRTRNCGYINVVPLTIRAQQVTEDILDQFLKSTEVVDQVVSLPSQTTSLNIKALRYRLHNEIKRETWTYLVVMNGVVENGETFVKVLRDQLTKGEYLETLTTATEITGSLAGDVREAIINGQKTIGFLGLEEVLRIFEDALEIVQLREAALFSTHSSNPLDALYFAEGGDSPSSHWQDTASVDDSKQQASSKSTSSGRGSGRKAGRRSSRSSSGSTSNNNSAKPSKARGAPRQNAIGNIAAYIALGLVSLFLFAVGCGHYIRISRQASKSSRLGYRYVAAKVGGSSHSVKAHSPYSKWGSWGRHFWLEVTARLSPKLAQVQEEQSSEDCNTFVTIIVEDFLLFVSSITALFSKILDFLRDVIGNFVDRPIEKGVGLRAPAVDKSSISVTSPSALSLSMPSEVASITNHQSVLTSGGGPCEVVGTTSTLSLKKNTKSSNSKKKSVAQPTSTQTEKSADLPSAALHCPSSPSSVFDDSVLNVDPPNVLDLCKGSSSSLSDVKTDISLVKVKAKKVNAGKKRSSPPPSLPAVMVREFMSEVEGSSDKAALDAEKSGNPEVLIASSDLATSEAFPESVCVEQKTEPQSFVPSRSPLDVYLPSEIWDGDDSEWIPAPSGQNKSSKQNGGSRGKVPSMRESQLYREQLQRKALEEEASRRSPRVKPNNSKGKEKDKSAKSSFDSGSTKSVSPLPALKEPEKATPSCAQPVSPQRTGKLGYSAVLVKNIPPPLSTEDGNPAAPVVSNGSPSQRKGGVKGLRHSVSAPPGKAYANQVEEPSFRGWVRTKTNSITSNSSTGTTIADEGEHGTLSDSDNSNGMAGGVFDGYPSHMRIQQPIPLLPTMPHLGYGPPAMYSQEDMQYGMMMNYPPIMAVPMAWSGSPDLSAGMPSALYCNPLSPHAIPGGGSGVGTVEMTTGDMSSTGLPVDSGISPGMLMLPHPHSPIISLGPSFFPHGAVIPSSSPNGFDAPDASSDPSLSGTMPFPSMVYLNHLVAEQLTHLVLRARHQM